MHPAGIFHEIVYLQGGHRTPDGFYAPGHHVTSAPLCKEGPWLAADDDGPLPEGWPRFDGGAPYRSPAPFAPPFADIPDAVGILFVHRGPFVLGDGAINWQKLAPLDLGPAG